MFVITASSLFICAVVIVVAGHMICMKKLEDYDGFRGVLKVKDDMNGNIIGKL